MSNINNRVFGQNVDPKIIKQFDRLQRGRFNTNPNQEIRPEDDFKDYIPVDDYIKGYEEMLSLLGLTSDTFNNEWDDETDRKS